MIPMRRSNDGRGLPTEMSVSTRPRAGAKKAPVVTFRCGPSRSFVAQTEDYRAVTNPWTKARATSAPAGLLARGSKLDARPSQGQHLHAATQWLPLFEKGAMCIALAAYSCRDSRGFGSQSFRTAFPFKPLVGHRRDHEDQCYPTFGFSS
ncbi:hypothetical protein HNQ99_000688 [Rhizorhapis suberifaciens]|uniref:Uncharacterized protein n=1 Tax=Rhizorhapis suberifaciens TaxID=13656 RepID=A0A840HS39_9SPHN|nr:hypothetical protein [Rhizorhapis suberifaciens]